MHYVLSSAHATAPMRLKSHVCVYAYSTCTMQDRMSVEEEQGTEGSSGFRKVHAFVLESSVLIWDPHGRFALAVDKYKIVSKYSCRCGVSEG